MRINEQGVTMKKTLLSITVALVALTMFFAACQAPVNPNSLTLSEKITAVSGPDWVEATAYPGANLVTWAFVKDAKSYTVYRQRDDRKDALVKLGITEYPSGGRTQYYYVDAVSFENQLVNEVEYIYYVTANSGQSITGRAVGGTSEPTIINDGSTSNTVTAIIPARDTVVTKLADDPETDDVVEEFAADWITDEKVIKSDGSEILLLTWPNKNPAFAYKVNYSIGKTVSFTVKTEDAAADILQDGYFNTPLFGGLSKVGVTVSLTGDTYSYYKPVTIEKDLTSYSLTASIDAPYSSGLAVTRDPGTQGTTAVITWTPDGDNAAKLASDYKLYRIKAKNVVNGAYNPGTADPVEIEGDWELVSGHVTQSGAGTQIKVVDVGIELKQAYLYALYAELEGRKSATSFYALKPAEIAQPYGYDATVTYAENATTGNRDYKVTIGWFAQAGVETYKLARAEKTTYPTQTYTGFTTELTVPKESVGGIFTVIDTPPIRKAYVYRLTAITTDGLTSDFYTELDGDVYAEYITVDNSYGNGSGDFSVAQSSIDAYTNILTFNPGYKNDLTVRIYRAEVPYTGTPNPNGTYSSANAVYTELTTTPLALKDTGTYSDSELTLGKYYAYRIAYYAGSKQLTILQSTNAEAGLGNGGLVQTPKTTTIIAVSDAGSTPTGATTTFYFRVTNPSAPLLGSQVQLQSKADTATPADPWTAGTVGSVVYIPLSATVLPTGSSLSAGDYYFTIVQPALAVTAVNAYRLVAVDQDGNTANTFDSATTVSGVGSSVEAW
jgi:hypothetical protein